MWIARLAFLVLILVFAMAGCSDFADKQAGNVNKDSLVLNDSIEDISYDACYENFFKGLPKFKDSGEALLILKDGSQSTLTQFFRDEFMSSVSQYGMKDLDSDGVRELIVYNNTGGAHCCDEYYVFEESEKQRFEYKASLVSGLACIDSSTNRLMYSFNETLGYFFGCYACGYEDTSHRFKSMREIKLRYNKRKFEVVPYASQAAAQNMHNLEILQKNGYEEIQGLMDNGWRKEFAMNFAVWHYNNGQNWKKTKKLFDKYYHFEDSVGVWTEFYNTLKEVKEQNSF